MMKLLSFPKVSVGNLDPRQKHSGMTRTSIKNLKVLVTCGATWTPIDDVRVISNVSSGQMGHLIAKAFSLKKAQVTVIEGPVAHTLDDKKIKVIKYRYFDELAKVLKQEISKKYDIIVHAAAVSDFKAAKVSNRKMASGKSISLKLIPTPKLIKQIKRLSPNSFLVGFKLESRLNQKDIFKTVRPLFKSSACDLVVANSIKQGYKGFIVNADGNILKYTESKEALAQDLVKLLI